MNLEQAKREFLQYIEIEKGRSLQTVINYDHYLSVFIKFLKKTSPKDITDDSVREFRLWLNRQAGKKTPGMQGRQETMKKRTQNYYLIALRAFLKFASTYPMMSSRGIPSGAPAEWGTH